MSLVQSLPTQALPQTRCPQCGSSTSHAGSPEEAQRRIGELEGQVRLLNAKAAAAADKLADYEDELQVLRKKTQQDARPNTGTSSGIASPPLDSNHAAPSQTLSTTPAPSSSSRLTSLSSLLPGRRTPAPGPSPHHHHPPLLPPPPPQSTPSTHSLPTTPLSPDAASATLTAMLQAETKARLAAESSLSAAHTELEELTAQLFSQANEMVASERKARAKLEERIEVLEKRDGEKRRRLERLEKAVARIERVRGMVG